VLNGTPFLILSTMIARVTGCAQGQMSQWAVEILEGDLPQALKRGLVFSDLTARVNSCPSRTLCVLP